MTGVCRIAAMIFSSPPQAFMLRIILEKSPIAYTALAGELNITKATCSRTVDGLIQLDLVSRLPTHFDGRSFELTATASAQAIREAVNLASA
jgi:DNA-binding MarR family transcriptional regulator